MRDECWETVSAHPTFARRCLRVPHAERVIRPAVAQTTRPIGKNCGVHVGAKLDAHGSLLATRRYANGEAVDQNAPDELPLNHHSPSTGVSLKEELAGDIASKIAGPLVAS